MSIYIQQSTGLKSLEASLTYQKIVDALRYVPFKGDYNDLTNKPITQTGNDSFFVIQDPSGNAVAQINESGLTVTNVNAYDIKANGVSLLTQLTQALANIQNIQTQLNTLPISGYQNSSYLSIQDPSGNEIARFDESGLIVANVTTNAINGVNVSALKTDIDNLKENALTEVDAEKDILSKKGDPRDGNYHILASNSQSTKAIWIDDVIYAPRNEHNEVKAKVDKLVGTDTNQSVRQIATAVLEEALIPESAQEALDTLQEIADWIQDHPDDAAAMNTQITENTNSINTLKPQVASVEAKTKNIADEEEPILFAINDADGNISIQVDESGTTTHKILTHEIEIRPIGKSTYDVTTRFEAIEAAAGNVQSISDATIQSLVSAAFASK